MIMIIDHWSDQVSDQQRLLYVIDRALLVNEVRHAVRITACRVSRKDSEFNSAARTRACLI